MDIKRVEIVGVGPIVEVSFELEALGLNVILGGNETGKSTLCATIVAILYGFRFKSEAQERRSWYGGDSYRGKLIVESNRGDPQLAVQVIRPPW